MRISTLKAFQEVAVLFMYLSIHPYYIWICKTKDKDWNLLSFDNFTLFWFVFILFCFGACMYRCETSLNSVEVL